MYLNYRSRKEWASFEAKIPLKEEFCRLNQLKYW